ncbi:MAG: signal peptidase II [bacterium]
MTRTVRHYLPLTLTLLVIFLDRLTKVIVSHSMKLRESIPFLGDTVRWTYIHNDGMALGINLINTRTLGILSLLAVIIVTWVFIRVSDDPKGIRWILAAILGGAVGNTYDRLVHGYVIDFVDVDLPNFLMERFAVFNVADSAVSVGVTVLILMLFLQKQHEKPLQIPELDTPSMNAPSTKETPIPSNESISGGTETPGGSDAAKETEEA